MSIFLMFSYCYNFVFHNFLSLLSGHNKSGILNAIFTNLRSAYEKLQHFYLYFSVYFILYCDVSFICIFSRLVLFLLNFCVSMRYAWTILVLKTELKFQKKKIFFFSYDIYFLILKTLFILEVGPYECIHSCICRLNFLYFN